MSFCSASVVATVVVLARCSVRGEVHEIADHGCGARRERKRRIG
jgi:hypothetical protein